MPIGIPVLEGIGTDTMRVRMDRPAVDTPNHRPVPDTAPLRLLDYVENVEAGFVEAYEVFRRHRASLLEPGGPLHAFADAEVRVIPRGTMLYATIRQTGFHPSLLSDALRRDEHFDCLWRNAPDQPTLANLIPAEQRDLWENDIPFFSASVDGTVLRDSTGATVPGVELKPGIVRIREAVDNLGTADRGRQLWLLRGSLATTVIDASQVMAAPSYELRLGLEPPPPHRLTAGAARIGDHLANIAVDEGDHAQWLGVNSSRGRNWTLGPLGPDLFHGLSGIALFLGALGASTQDARYTGLARRALATARGQVDRGLLDVGGMAGLAGVVWTLCHLGRLWNEEELVDLARHHARRLADLVSGDTEYDVVAGAAGSILALRALYRLHPSGELRELVRRHADQLVAAARPFPPGLGWLPESLVGAGLAKRPLAGLAHGQAGIAWALLEAATITEDERFLSTACEALAYERALFDPEVGNWRDMRNWTGDLDGPIVAWCHGAAGIGLARLACAPHIGFAEVSDEIDTALVTTVRDGFGTSHCQCHGDLGNLELLLQGARVLGRPALREQAGSLAQAVLESIDEHSWICGVALGTETPGMLVGLAGIGYGMLRVASPDRVPSVLTLDP
jgi:type 2 lantibiotic biosynthesis protein LanM